MGDGNGWHRDDYVNIIRLVGQKGGAAAVSEGRDLVGVRGVGEGGFSCVQRASAGKDVLCGVDGNRMVIETKKIALDRNRSGDDVYFVVLAVDKVDVVLLFCNDGGIDMTHASL